MLRIQMATFTRHYTTVWLKNSLLSICWFILLLGLQTIKFLSEIRLIIYKKPFIIVLYSDFLFDFDSRTERRTSFLITAAQKMFCVSYIISNTFSIYCRCDADPAALAKYVLALIKKDMSDEELQKMMIGQLEVFLENGNYLIIQYIFLSFFFFRNKVFCEFSIAYS